LQCLYLALAGHAWYLTIAFMPGTGKEKCSNITCGKYSRSLVDYFLLAAPRLVAACVNLVRSTFSQSSG
jgi:hypothetical protein